MCMGMQCKCLSQVNTNEGYDVHVVVKYMYVARDYSGGIKYL